MAIAIIWDTEEQTAIRWDFDGQWSQEDLFAAEETTNQLLSEAHDTVVDLILNLGDTTYFPPNAMVAIRNILKRVSRGTGVKVIVGATGITQKLLKTFSKLDQPFVEGMTFVPDMQEARELLLR